MPEEVSVLVVAHQTAATPGLLEAVHERAERGPAKFHLVVPRMPHGMHKVVDPQDTGQDDAQHVLDDALPKLSEAAGTEVAGSLGDADPICAIQDAVNLETAVRGRMARRRSSEDQLRRRGHYGGPGGAIAL